MDAFKVPVIVLQCGIPQAFNNSLSLFLSLKDAENLIRWMLSFHPEDRPTLEQVINHPWMKATSSSSSSSRNGLRPSTSASRPNSSSTSSHMSSSSSPYFTGGHISNYHRPPSSYHQSCSSSSSFGTWHSHEPAARSDAFLSPRPSSSSASSSSSSCSSGHASPMQTRSQTRAGRLQQGSPVRGGGEKSRSRHHYGGGGFTSRPASGGEAAWINGCPRTPITQVRKGHGSQQVTRKK